MDRILKIYFDPPMAIARVGAAAVPVDAYDWVLAEDPHKGVETRIRPAWSLYAVPCGAKEPLKGEDIPADDQPCTLFPKPPGQISFKDPDEQIRPVAPFFQMWADVMSGTTGGVQKRQPVTPTLLASVGASLSDITYRATAANRKAQSRTKLASDAAIARVDFSGDDFTRHRLNAISPHTEDQVQMVTPDNPLPLGSVQAFAPAKAGDAGHVEGANLDQVRLRFTPGSGATFGPPDAIEAPASPLAPGEFEPPIAEYGRIHEMTAPENRFLNQDSTWSGYNFRTDGTPKWPTPMDSYDGARVGDGNGWGLIDDTCDLVIEAELTAQGQTFNAIARSFAGPPDFAPDKRPFYSIQDELEDRDLPDTEPSLDGTPAEILDLFRRIFETASLLNLDQRRNWALGGNASILGPRDPSNPEWDKQLSPRLGPESMREKDKPYADLVPAYTPGQTATMASVSGSNDRLPYTQVISAVHARMAASPILRDFLARRPGRVRELVRPPFARFKDLPERPGAGDAGGFRDPRGLLDQLYDMRMPPYMRHSMGVPLSITMRQYNLLMAYLNKLENDPKWRVNPEVVKQPDASGKEKTDD